jgi:hypothetical protein
MSEHMKRAHWVQNLINDPRILFTVNEKTFEGTARLVDQEKDAKLASKIAKLVSAKYKWDRGLIVEIIQINSVVLKHSHTEVSFMMKY